MNEDLITALEAAEKRKISVSHMRHLIAQYGIEAEIRGIGRKGRNLYPAELVLAIPSSQQGVRNDILSDRIARMLTAARLVAEQDGGLNEWRIILQSLLNGDALMVSTLQRSTLQWARGNQKVPGISDAVAKVNQLFEEIGELPSSLLPVSVRKRIAEMTNIPVEKEENGE